MENKKGQPTTEAIFRGIQRLGDKLMTHALSLAKSRGVKAVYLEVRESNTPARRLYEKYGYTALGVRKNYYAYPRENAVIMQKQL